MRRKYEVDLFCFKSSSSLRNHNQLFVGETPLFVCGADAMMLVETAIKLSEEGRFFCTKDVSSHRSYRSPDDIRDIDQFVYDQLLYLAKCQVLDLKLDKE